MRKSELLRKIAAQGIMIAMQEAQIKRLKRKLEEAQIDAVALAIKNAMLEEGNSVRTKGKENYKGNESK